MTNRFYDLTFNHEPDGSIYLEQHCGIDDPVSIFAHPAQLRYICESFGLVAPTYPADELSKRLAVQLCTILRELEDERHRSHWLDMTYTKLDAWCSALPDNIFPHHLWDDDERAESTANDAKPIHPCPVITPAKKMQPSAIAEGGEQLGLAV